ncbi:MAG TPA: hypothetical protein PLM20_06700 [Syntrophomonadaceae bacterium]|nr:hypothetical protein [Syntrophomonadaceae bacterium]HQA07846.1 hypothetical protein [Syntrophomonadaceae bacterium]HQE23575.1 hypothetical protein [Syntrophomonadaceae bacterium]
MLEKQDLRRLCVPPAKGKAYYRPLICQGNHEYIKLFLVGLNPATPISENEMSLDKYVKLISHYDEFLGYFRSKHEITKTRKAIMVLLPL